MALALNKPDHRHRRRWLPHFPFEDALNNAPRVTSLPSSGLSDDRVRALMAELKRTPPSGQASGCKGTERESQDFASVIADEALGLDIALTAGRGWQPSADALRFLGKHPFLVQVLEEAYPVIVRHFGEDATCKLRVIQDPDGGPDELHGVVLTRLASREALRRLDDLDDEWWLDQLPRARGRLVLSIEHI